VTARTRTGVSWGPRPPIDRAQQQGETGGHRAAVGDDTAAALILCAWCGREVMDGGPAVSHGMCPECIDQHAPRRAAIRETLRLVALVVAWSWLLAVPAVTP